MITAHTYPFTVKVLYEHLAQDDDELTIRPGDFITGVIVIDDSWSYGALSEVRGFFPSNYVRVSPIYI